MLAAIGVSSMDDLLVDIPRSLRLAALELPAGLSEFETMAHIESLAAQNRVFPDRLTFRGGGVYRRFIPAAVAAVTSKPEFYTAYTPYQPEASQGTLQALSLIHISEPTRQAEISYAVFCLKKKKNNYSKTTL